VLDRAPSRGRYSRESSAIERFWAQRRRVLEATLLAGALHETSVTAVARIAGVGRSTFYECFDDFAHALDAATKSAMREVREVLAGVRRVARVEGARGATTSELLDLLSAQWVRCAFERPAAMLCALASEEAVAGFVSAALDCAQVSGRASMSVLVGGDIAAPIRAREVMAIGLATCGIEVAREVASGALQGASVGSPALSGIIAGPHLGLVSQVPDEAQQALAATLRMLLR
jgi:AcrR family transcriptional regulator